MAERMIASPRDFPAIEELLQSPELADLIGVLPRPLAAMIVKQVVADGKQKLKQQSQPLSYRAFLETITTRLKTEIERKISRVINASGIVVHTNLGRAPLSETIFEEIKRTVVGYGNIEFDIASGKRGRRGEACESYLALLSGAEAGTVVNNGAAALFVILNTLAKRKKVLISRGELVQIGGGFRIPDILKRSGAKLCEVGTTNITSVADYEKEIDSQTGLILKVHKSNFIQAGFTQEAPLADLVALGREHDVPVVNDLGSGVFIPTIKTLGYREATVQESVRAGASLTCFSGDKMLGGGQAGLIVGRRDMVAKVKKNPIFRTVRVDKIVFAILEKLLAIYLNGTHETDIKLWQIFSTPVSELRRRALGIQEQLGGRKDLTVENTTVYVGGGALPEQAIPSVGLVFSTDHEAEKLMKAFRTLRPPIIGRIDKERFILDLKTVDTADLDYLVSAIRKIIG